VTWTKEPSVLESLTAPIRYPSAVVPNRGSTGTVVATDPASVDADYDNGAVLQDEP